MSRFVHGACEAGRANADADGGMGCGGAASTSASAREGRGRCASGSLAGRARGIAYLV